MRGRGRPISTVLTDALAGRPSARLAAIAAAFAEACGWPLAREASVRAVTRERCLVIVASTRGWADQVEALGPRICARVNARLGREVASALDVRVGPLGR
jgi:Dna[CI] antecedent, DciA